VHPVRTGAKPLVRRLAGDVQRLTNILPGRSVFVPSSHDLCSGEPIGGFGNLERSDGNAQVARCGAVVAIPLAGQKLLHRRVHRLSDIPFWRRCPPASDVGRHRKEY
jgi:hypothetical protein